MSCELLSVSSNPYGQLPQSFRKTNMVNRAYRKVQLPALFSKRLQQGIFLIAGAALINGAINLGLGLLGFGLYHQSLSKNDVNAKETLEPVYKQIKGRKDRIKLIRQKKLNTSA